jgi:hypothetical protein
MLTWTRFFEKVDRFVPWVPWMTGASRLVASMRERRGDG